MTSPLDWSPAPGVAATRLADGTAALLHLATMEYFTLNATGVAIWEGVVAGRPVGAIAEILVGEHGAGADDAAETVTGFLEDLAAAGLVERVGS